MYNRSLYPRGQIDQLERIACELMVFRLYKQCPRMLRFKQMVCWFLYPNGIMIMVPLVHGGGLMQSSGTSTDPV